MSNIGRTYDLADQLPSNREFRHFLSFVSTSGVRCKPSISVTCDRTTTDLWARDPRTSFISLSAWIRAPEPQPWPDYRDKLATDLRLTCDDLRPIGDRPTNWARPPRVTCVGKSLHVITFQEWFATDLRPCRMTYEAIEWVTTNLQRLGTKRGCWVTREWN